MTVSVPCEGPVPCAKVRLAGFGWPDRPVRLLLSAISSSVVMLPLPAINAPTSHWLGANVFTVNWRSPPAIVARLETHGRLADVRGGAGQLSSRTPFRKTCSVWSV